MELSKLDKKLKKLECKRLAWIYAKQRDLTEFQESYLHEQAAIELEYQKTNLFCNKIVTGLLCLIPIFILIMFLLDGITITRTFQATIKAE